MSKGITCFKAYDARGKVPTELNEEITYRIGRAYAEFIMPKCFAVDRDVRLGSEALFAALCNGLTDSGVDVLGLGLCGTEQVYFAAFHLQLDGGIMNVENRVDQALMEQRRDVILQLIQV